MRSTVSISSSDNEETNSALPVSKLKKVHSLLGKPEKYAEALDLIYVSDKQPGIKRTRRGDNFIYHFNRRQVKRKAELERIKKLAIPPAWENVWICPLTNGHIQATGIDARNRKQYRYHRMWNARRNETKFYRMLEFGKCLPRLREKLKKDIAIQEFTQEKILAALISLMERTYIRVGNSEYEKENGSYGLSTLKNRHVKIKGDMLSFSFKGKKGIHHKISLRNKRLAKIIKQSKEIPGKELFEYYDENGNPHGIDSGKVNEYIKEATGGDFTAKDFRTWAGTLHMLRALGKTYSPGEAEDSKKNIAAALDEVSRLLGNTRTVCKNYYVNPLILNMYDSGSLVRYLNELNETEQNSNSDDLVQAEKVLMKILKSVA